MKPKHDIHIHTVLSSCCSDPNQVIKNILEKAKALEIQTIGISDHVWDSSEVGISPSPWYRPQDFDHIMKIKESIPKDTKGIRVLLGCESEFYGDTLALSLTNKAKLKYALVPHSHIHMGSYVMPDSCVSDEQIGEFLCESFKKLVSHKVATSIAHPMFPCGYEKRLQGIIGSISDDKMEELCYFAKDNETALEINTGMFPAKLANGIDNEPMMRLFKIAKACGCKFTFGTDAHSLSELDNIKLVDAITDACGITELDLPDFLR